MEQRGRAGYSEMGKSGSREGSAQTYRRNTARRRFPTLPHPVFQPEHKLLAVPFLRIRQAAVQLMEVMKHQYGFLRGRCQQHRPFDRATPAPYPGGPDPLCGYGGRASPHLRLSGGDGPLAEGPRDAAHYQSV